MRPKLRVMSSDRGSDVCVVVRECGERTADLCVQQLEKLLPDAICKRVSGERFDVALRRSLEAGLEVNRAWTLCIDADVLVVPQLLELLHGAQTAHPDVFALQGLVLDKLMGCKRPAGNHLYRTALVGSALSVLRDDNPLRPETAMIQAMQVKGFRLLQSHALTGLHDFEQSYADIYAKAWVHSHKHTAFSHLYLPMWQTFARTDADFQVALEAATDARESARKPRLSRLDTAAAATAVLARLGLTEKAPLLATTRPSVADEALPTHSSRIMLQDQFDRAVFPRWRKLRHILATPKRIAQSGARSLRLIAPLLRANVR